jgi:hypothetical protein
VASDQKSSDDQKTFSHQRNPSCGEYFVAYPTMHPREERKVRLP